MLPNQWMGDIHSDFVFQALRCAAPGVDCELLGLPAQKSKPAPVSHTHEKVKIKSERLSAREDPAKPPVLIAEFDIVGSTGDDLTQLLTGE